MKKKPDPECYILTYSPAYIVLDRMDLVYQTQQSENLKPDVLLWSYLEDPLHSMEAA